MKKHDAIKGVWIMTILAISTSVFAARRPAPVSLTPEGKKLEAHYSKMLADLEEQSKRLEPKMDEKKKAEFTKQFGSLRSVPPVTKVVMGKDVTVKYGPGNPAFAEKQKEVLTAARAVMKDMAACFVGEKEQAIMAKFALLTHATPNCLAGFAQKGEEEKSLMRNASLAMAIPGLMLAGPLVGDRVGATHRARSAAALMRCAACRVPRPTAPARRSPRSRAAAPGCWRR